MKVIFILLPLIIIAGLLFRHTLQSSKNPPLHYHAGFVVYVDGVRQDFTDFKYMNLTPCSEHVTKKSPAEEQIEKAHLHEGVGDVVHVHRPGSTWRDLFRNLNYDFPAGLTVTGYVNGNRINDILSQPITPNESVIIVAGKVDGIDLNGYVTQEHIKDIQSQSELCSS